MMRVMTTSRQELISFDYDSILSFLNTENKWGFIDARVSNA
jgi:hypothetical protein